MHPIFKNQQALLGYTAAWVPLALVYGFMLAFAGRLTRLESLIVTVPVVCVTALACLAPWYVCKALPLKNSPAFKAVVGHVVTAMWISAAETALVDVSVMFLNRAFPGLDSRFKSAGPVLAGMIFLTYLLSAALHYVVLAVESSRQAELLSREAQLKALKAQINPHFLFNSLNSISALTTADPRRARDMCIRLSDFLRNSLRLGERMVVPFGEELALTRTYLDVEQVRFGDRLRVRQEFDGDCKDCEVPPLLVQPLIENAIKHGIATLVEGGEIGMSGKRMRDGIKVTIENPFDPEAPAAEKSGFGLINVRNRLEARYGKAARLDIYVEDKMYKVVLSVPWSQAKVAQA
jgi:two-component system sensor histidine kinase AlgZ